MSEFHPTTVVFFGLAAFSLVGLQACVVPNDAVTGAEVSWYVLELSAEDADTDTDTETGDPEPDPEDADAPKARTCAGGLITRVQLEITDQNDEGRNRQFQYTCNFGQQSPEANLTSPAEIFIELGPGRYTVEWTAIDDPADREVDGPPKAIYRETLEFRVDRGLETLVWPIETAAPPLVVELTGLDDCDTLAARLIYAAPSEDLFGHSGDADDPEPTPYRPGAMSDAGLALDGEPTACSELASGAHRFESLDRGRYELELVRNAGTVCTVPVVLDGSPDDEDSTTLVVLDLSDQPC